MEYEGKTLKIYIDNKKIEYYNIKFFEIVEEINKHNELKLKLQIDNEQASHFQTIMEQEDLEIKIEISFENSEVREIFLGIIDYFEYTNYGNDGYEIDLKSFSKSVLLDRKKEKKYRVFQDVKYTYENIIDEINKEYVNKNIKVQSTNESKKEIENLIIQYEETDWEFLVRLSSYLRKTMFVNEKGVISFGTLENRTETIDKKEIFNYSFVKDYENKYFKISCNNVVKLGSNVILNDNNEEYVVIKSKIYLENNIIKSDFVATDLKKYKIERKYNNKILGNRIEVVVEKVFEERNIAKMEVSFKEGLRKIVQKCAIYDNKYKSYEDYGVNKCALSYQTFYSQSNTGFFCTPEIGDVVEVYFDSMDESNAKVSWAINNKGNGRFSDYENRNFQINGNDFSFKINKDSMELNVKESFKRNSRNSVESAENIVNKSSKNLVVISDDYLGMESLGETILYGDSIEIIGKKGDIKIETPSEIRIKGKKVHNN